jgi:hypothetical protein
MVFFSIACTSPGRPCSPKFRRRGTRAWIADVAAGDLLHLYTSTCSLNWQEDKCCSLPDCASSCTKCGEG